jgi:alpha-1,6-mannosyltransferase
MLLGIALLLTLYQRRLTVARVLRHAIPAGLLCLGKLASLVCLCVFLSVWGFGILRQNPPVLVTVLL